MMVPPGPVPVPNTGVYTWRLTILFLFSYSCMLQGCVWNTWGPIAQSAEEVFDWTDASIALLPSWGNIMNCLTILPVTWFMNKKGILSLSVKYVNVNTCWAFRSCDNTSYKYHQPLQQHMVIVLLN